MSDVSARVAFVPASDLPYECTIHTFQVQGDDGRTYRVVLDLIRSDKNEQWKVMSDRRALRAGVLDDGGQVVASIFVDAPKDRFTSDVGLMHIMDANGHISFVAARGSDGQLRDGQLDFDLHVELLPSGMVQSFSHAIKDHIEKHLESLPPDQREAARTAMPIQLLVTDYCRTRHTGTITVKRPGVAQPVTLRADNTPSTMSHHFGNALTEYVFLASVPQHGAPSFISVITLQAMDFRRERAGVDLTFPFGYLLRTDAEGNTSFSLLRVKTDAHKDSSTFEMGSKFWGSSLNVQPEHEVGAVGLNEGHLPARTAFGRVTLHEHGMAEAMGLTHGDTFANVVIDVTGRFVQDVGWSQV